jgi:thiol-disulfide isomerase/thioredoxin
MKKITFFTFIILSTAFSLKAEGYRISVEWGGLSDSTVYLAHYFDSRIYVNDSIKLNSSAKGTFTGDEKLDEGLYVLYYNDKVYFDVLIGNDQEFKITTSNPDVYGNLQVMGAEESERFHNYQNFLKLKGAEKSELMQKFRQAGEIEKAGLRPKIEALDNEMTNFIDAEREKIPGSMYSVFMNGVYQPPVPEPDVPKTHPQYDSISWFHNYAYNRDHFLDYIDFSDNRILNTPLLRPKLETYFNKILLQAADSVIPYAMKVIHRAEANDKMFQYVSQFLLNNAIQSNIMGMDAVFVSIADSVYLNGKATWADSTTLMKIAEEAYLSRYNLIGNKAPDMKMTSIEGMPESLYELVADYTVIVFWEPGCGHCKKEIPELYKRIYSEFPALNIEVFAVFTGDDENEWKKFVENKELAGWHHVWDPKHFSKYRFKYNVKTTPLIYLLDKDKKIVAKRIDYINLIKLINTLLK